MTPIGGDGPLLTDRDVEALAWQFLNSDYAGDTYADWPIDQRLGGFLRHRGLVRIADDGDIYNIILDRVMTYINVTPSSPHDDTGMSQRLTDLGTSHSRRVLGA